MKRRLFILITLILCVAAVQAQEQGDEYDDGYVYESNGAGDQFLKADLTGLFPLNFGNQLYPGAAATIGYFRFLNGWLAVGGEVTATYNVSLGRKILIMLPITFGAMAQAEIGKIEIPVTVTAGIGYETWQNMNYFPSFVLKGSAGAYYRFNDMWSLGLSSTFIWIPQPYSNSSRNDNGMFLTAALGVRYHF